MTQIRTDKESETAPLHPHPDSAEKQAGESLGLSPIAAPLMHDCTSSVPSPHWRNL